MVFCGILPFLHLDQIFHFLLFALGAVHLQFHYMFLQVGYNFVLVMKYLWKYSAQC